MTEAEEIAGKLTEARLRLLRELPCNAVEGYRPAEWLLNVGLATAEDGAYGSRRLSITDLGRSILQGEKE